MRFLEMCQKSAVNSPDVTVHRAKRAMWVPAFGTESCGAMASSMIKLSGGGFSLQSESSVIILQLFASHQNILASKLVFWIFVEGES